jgi:hypothetical protein
MNLKKGLPASILLMLVTAGADEESRNCIVAIRDTRCHSERVLLYNFVSEEADL